MKVHNVYPKELFVPIEGSSYHLGRLTVNSARDGFVVEIDIVLKESRKIWSSVKRIYGQSDEQEAIDNSMQILGEFLRGQSVK